MSSNSANASTNGNKNKGGGGMGLFMGILLIIIFLYLIYTQIVGYRSYYSSSPYLIEGIVDGNVARKIPANKLPLSSDTAYGSEFTYSFWIFLNDTNFAGNATSTCGGDAEIAPLFKHIFHKGSYDFYAPSVPDKPYHYPLLQSPGVWLYPNTNKLNIRFNTYDNVVETADIGNIPLNMWVNINIILIGNSVDVYVNGNLKKRTKLGGVPKINYGDLYITNWLGFLGYLCRFRYFNYAIQPFQVDEIFRLGPAPEIENDVTNQLSRPAADLSPNYWLTSGYPSSQNFPNRPDTGAA